MDFLKNAFKYSRGWLMTEKMEMLLGEKSNTWVNQCVHATYQFLLFDFRGLFSLSLSRVTPGRALCNLHRCLAHVSIGNS